MNEWEFTADVASWINELLQKDRNLPFSRAKCEQRGKGSLKRRDLTLLDKSQRVVLTGEVKLPYRKDGGSPYNSSVVNDARRKAARAKAPFFFTWNVNECVLWETVPPRTSWKDQNYKSWDVTSVHKESHMLLPMTLHAIQIWLPTFLNDLAQILHGTTEIGRKSPDEKFIEALESSLQLPILLTIEELVNRYKKSRLRTELDKWMRDEQGWIIYDDPEGIRDNLERTAKFTCYAMVNKLVFYEALLKRFGVKMQKLAVPDHISTGDALRLHLEGYFAEARVITGDYETVFGEDHTSIGNRIPFYSDHAVAHWRALIDQIHKFDFSKLDYEVIGSIFEHLISPEERHKFGQFYTSVEVVDLINSFCIRDGHEKVMDPACGGGTFLVRAYARKRELAPTEKHGKRLSDLFGVDISQFATHLTTINLATRDLIDDENYPQIARSDFFDIEVKKPFLSLPTHVKARGLGKIQHRKVEIPQLDAVVGNPPYIRQEDIPKSKSKKRVKHGTKEYYQQLIKRESGTSFSGRSDIHCYFWPHATSFLKDGGSLSLVTSSQWLDVEYGFKLQDWMLQHFQILAVFESIDEPWFVGARVATTVTILRRQKDTSKRMNNTVRFVQLRRPVKELLGHDGTTAGAVRAADTFRDEILGLKGNTVNDRYRARVIRQGDLWNNGVELGVMMGKSSEPPSTDPSEQSGHYYGGKWGVYLRAPDLWFDLLDAYGSRFAPLGDLADVRFGVKSGKDCFFFPKDCSQACLDAHQSATDFRKEYGVPRKDVQSGKVKLVLCGEGRGEVRPIEAEYLEPEVHSLMEIDGFTVTSENCRRMILLIDKPKSKLKGTHVLRYIAWGEKQGYHKGATCAARVTSERQWYDLTGHTRGRLFWPKAQQYKHAIPVNNNVLQCNCNLYDLCPKHIDDQLMAGILNSTIVILSKYQYGRPVGVEGNLKTEVVDVNMMLVPKPIKANSSTSVRVTRAFRAMKKRKALQLLPERRLRRMAYLHKGKEDELQELSDRCELDMDDRRQLDDAVLELLGVTSRKTRQELIDRLYSYLRDFFEWTRQKEEKAIVNKKNTKRRGPAKPVEIARQIYDELIEKRPDFLKEYDPDFLDRNKPFDTFDIPAEGEAQVYSDMLVPHAVRFTKGNKELAIVATNTPSQDALLVLLIKSGTRGLVRVPHEEQICRDLLARYDRFIQQRVCYVLELIKDRTADEDMQEAIFEATMPLLRKE
ncbi:MAG: SAM-dependent DNA methyltransferase [Planctomycetes bacterium]|nr:SAM-dependent DNA methyltransferase [Planctomycetota bacterium]